MGVDCITGKKNAVMYPNLTTDSLANLNIFLSFRHGAVYGGCFGCAYCVYRGPVDMFRLHRIRLHNLLNLVHKDLAVLLFPISPGQV